MAKETVSLSSQKEALNPNAKIILVDQDGVLADFEGEFLRRWRKKFPDLPFIPVEERKLFYVQEEYPEDLRSRVNEIVRGKGFFADLPPIEGAIEGLTSLKEMGHIVKICTSPLIGSKDCVQDKHDWVIRHLGKEWVRDIIITSDKTLVHGDILIDDKPKITGAVMPSWEHVIFEAPFNRDVNDERRRLRGWKNLQEIFPM